MARGAGAGTCEGCGVEKDRLYDWQGLRLCATCQTIAGNVRNHQGAVERLYHKVAGAELVAGQEKETGGAEIDYLHEVVAQVNEALGGGHSAGDLAGVVRSLAARCKVMEGAVQVAEDHGTECDPHNCKELREALAVVLEVSEVLRGRCATPEKPGALAAAVDWIVAENERLRDEVERLHQPPTMEDGGAAGNDQYLVPDGYEMLQAVFTAAIDQAANGKGKERHATDEPFDRQPTCRDARDCGAGFPIGQALKKARESLRLTGGQQVAEILGAINYLAVAVIVLRETLLAAREAA